MKKNKKNMNYIKVGNNIILFYKKYTILYIFNNELDKF